MSDCLEGKTLLCTGGTGSLGNALVEELRNYKPKKVIIYSRNEYNQHLMAQKYRDLAWLRFLIGDVRDRDRLMWCCNDVDYLIHAAALKRIEQCEYAPLEAIKTNINGSANIVEACVHNNIEQAILISTDKAFEPRNVYGATKMTAERLFLAANSYNRTHFKSIRYGNVLASHGSVVEIFQKLKEQGVKTFPITHLDCSRFFWTLSQAAQAVLSALTAPANSPDLVVPRLPSMKITDLARAIDPTCGFEIIGLKPGEKLNETLDEGYSSDTNTDWLSVENIREILKIDIDRSKEAVKVMP